MTTDQIIYSTLLDLGIPDPLALIVTAQSKWETAVNGVPYMSDVFQTDNNAFGFGYDGQGNYFGYLSVQDSVADMVDYLNARVIDGSFPPLANITTVDQYTKLLKNAKPGAYYGDTQAHYSAGVQSYYQNSISLPLVTGATLILAAIVGFFIFS